LTLYGGTDYDLTGGSITLNYVSPMKVPMGFPASPTKWTVEVTDTSSRSQGSPGAGTWYNAGSITISIPIGIWYTSYKCHSQYTEASTGGNSLFTTLSTASDSESDVDMTCRFYGYSASSYGSSAFCYKYISAVSKTSYYLNIKTADGGVDTIYIRGDVEKTIIRAVCAYL